MPSEDLVKRAVLEMRKGYAQYQYFFDSLNSADWLEPLFREGFFRKPTDPRQEGDYVRLAIWPESRYLIRMAEIADAQAKVLEIALRIPYSENSRVHDDIADIALRLPPELAAKLAPQLCQYTKSPIKLLLAERLTILIPYLAKGGQISAALQLTAAALALSPDSSSGGAESARRLAEPQPRFKDCYYARIIRKSLPALVEAGDVKTIKLLCDLLDAAARLSFRDEEEGDEDYFYIRYPAIEHGPGRDDMASVLLWATREASVELISAKPYKFGAVIEILRQHKWTSFRRLELYLSRVFARQGISVAESIFKNPAILDQASLRHEAILLLKQAFSQLSEETSRDILKWVDAGPPEEQVRKLLEFVKQPASDENVIQIKNIRRRDRFAILEGQLPEAYQRKYEALIGELGPPVSPDRLPIRTFGQIGSQSPRSSAELATMPVEEVIDYLRSWKPGNDIFAPTADGLSHVLTSVVAQRPTDFIAVIDRFKTLDPTYIRGLFAGMISALTNGTKVDWKPLLELATWVASQPRSIEGRKGGLMVADPDWGWTRDSIIDLLKIGFDITADRLPYDYRALAWGALEPLTDDPFPLPENEGGEKFDPSFLSINCTRGRALFAVMQYAQWVRKNLSARKPPENPPVGLSLMPEVKAIIERHLDLREEPRLTIRSVYGQELSFLAGLDWEWFRANIGRIFPTEEADAPFFNAAWESFVVFNQPYDTLLKEMEPVYRKAIADINVVKKMQSPASPEDSLADHLMAYYWRGHLTFEGKDRLLEDFYAVASGSVRAHGMWFIGRSAAGWDDAVPPEVMDRLRNLLERRLKLAEEDGLTASFEKELRGFGWWFTSGKFGDKWAIEMLVRVLSLTKNVDGGMDVVQKLAILSSQYPTECVVCLDLIIRGDKEGWAVLGVEIEAREIIRTVFESGQHEAVLTARRLVEFLIARGQYGFRTVLS